MRQHRWSSRGWDGGVITTTARAREEEERARPLRRCGVHRRTTRTRSRLLRYLFHIRTYPRAQLLLQMCIIIHWRTVADLEKKKKKHPIPPPRTKKRTLFTRVTYHYTVVSYIVSRGPREESGFINK